MFKPALILSAVLTAGIASAADPLTDAMQQAYVPYRVVLSKTNTKMQDESRLAHHRHRHKQYRGGRRQ